MAKETHIVVLDDGEKITSTKDVSASDVKGLPCYYLNWAAGKPAHISLSWLGHDVAEKIPGVKIGELGGVPVIDPNVLTASLIEAGAEKFGFDVSKIRLATNRAASAEVKAKAKKYEALTANPAVMEALKTSDPELFAALTGEQLSEEPEDEEESEDDEEKLDE